ncbi:putative secreted protein (Por secretion system target) [Flavobacteriaceae bacterium MAR_2010_105]|nr:putative secreted protein (Por secretion system target) [Flavobacteriaceae bacterium MAR_2010_105]
MKKRLLLCLSLLIVGTLIYTSFGSPKIKNDSPAEKNTSSVSVAGHKKTPEERALFVEERALYEFNMQVNPLTGEIPLEEKEREFNQAKKAKLKINSNSRTIQTSYINRGPTNFGGRTRALVIDKTDVTGNTMIAGGVSSGVFRTTNGGASWTKVSSNDEIHNVTAIVQDPRSGFENIWYYGTGEAIGNSARLSGAHYYGQGIWQSTNGGQTWTQMPSTASNQTAYDSDFDFIFNLAVNPTNGQLFAAVPGKILRFNGSTWTPTISTPGSINTSLATDVAITTGGRVYLGFSGTNDATVEGVWTSPNGVGTWSRISNPSFTPAGRVVLALAPSNENKLYVLFDNGNQSECDTTPLIEADLWMWNQSNSTFTNYSSKLPDETGCSDGNDPFAIQGGYDLVVGVKRDNENFVVIGGTNAYKIANITTDATFTRIGGYANTSGYSLYANHHPDIHALVFSPFNNSILFTGTDGGLHRTDDITASTVAWTSLNNNYQTYQYYHVAIDPQSGSNIVIGGTQDNGTKYGGTDAGLPDLTTHAAYLGGDGVAVGISRDDACTPFFLGFQNGRMFRDCPGPFTEITPEDQSIMPTPEPYPSQFVTYFYLDQNNNNAIYYAAQNTLLRSTDATNVTSSTWDDLGDTSLLGHSDSFITFSTSWGAYNPATSYLLMGGSNGHIYRLNNPQNAASIASAVDITPSGATIANPSIVTGLAIHPTNNDIVLATYSNYGTQSIFLTTNATNPSPTWTLVERNLSAHSIRSAAIVENSGETTFMVGTARGLYSSTDPVNVDWVREAPTQIGMAVVSSLKYRPADHKLLIGTHGNGMYEATINSTLGLDDNSFSKTIKLYPNPAQAYLNVKLAQDNGSKVSYEIYNLLGQTISFGILENDRLNTSQLTSGLYLLKVKTAEGAEGVKSFIKK